MERRLLGCSAELFTALSHLEILANGNYVIQYVITDVF